MGVKFTRMLEISGSPSSEQIKDILKRAKRYFNSYGSGYAGIAKDPKARFKQHNDRLISGKGNKFHTEKWPLCVVICKLSKYENTKKLERLLIDLAKKKYQGGAWNDRKGGAGRPPSDGSLGFVYLLLDKRATQFIEATDAEWKEMVNDKKKIEEKLKSQKKSKIRA